MKILSEKEGGFYNNKLLLVSVLVLMIAGLAWVVYATITVDFDGPDDASLDWDGAINFNCTFALSGTPVSNISLYHNFSGSWQLNKTNTSAILGSPGGYYYNFTFGVQDINTTTSNNGWYCAACEIDGSCYITSSNRTIRVDQTAPTAFNILNSTMALNNTVVSGSVNSYIILNWSTTTEDHFINYTVFVYNSTTFISANLVALNKTTTISATNVNVTPLSSVGTTFADSSYYWYVRAYEDQSAVASASRIAETNSTQKNMFFIIDTQIEVATLNAPGEGTWDNDGSIIFNYTVTDANPDTCTIYYNITGSVFIANQSNTSLSDNDFVFSSPAVSLDDGNYTWFVECNDTTAHKGNSTSRTFKVDDTDPVVGLDNPSNATYDTDAVVYFDFTTIETYVETCVLWHDESGTYQANQTVDYTSGTQMQFTNSITFASNGTYVWNVVCNDTAGNVVSNATNYTLYIDTGAPIMALVEPANNAYKDSATVLFNYTANDIFLDTCILYGNFSGSWATNQTNSSLPKGSEVAIWASLGLTDGKVYKWNALCNDTSGSYSTWLSSTNYTVTVDTTNPVVSLDSPANNSYVSTTFAFTYTGTDTNIDTCTLWGNFSSTYTANESNSSVTSGTADTVTLANALSDGYYTWNVVCNDSAANSASNATNYTFTADSISPVVALNSPADNTWDIDGSVTFNWTGTDTNIDSCTLYGNFSNGWAANVSISTVTSGVSNKTTLALSNGIYVWNVLCNDSAANSAFNATNRTLYVDSTILNISTSINGTTTSSRVITFTVAAIGVSPINQSSIQVVPNASAGSNFNYTNDCISDGSNGYTCSYIETGLTAGEQNILNVSAKNNVSTYNDYDIYITPSATYNFTIALKSGWNLVSTPLILESTSVGNVVANDSYISSIYSFDGSDWTSWTSNSPCTSGSSCLTNMAPLEGYWVYTSATTSLYLFGNTTTGTQPAGYGVSYPKVLAADKWYLIGHYTTNYLDNYNTNTALDDLCGLNECYQNDKEFSSLLWYDSSKTPPLNSTEYPTYNGDAIWDRGRGFWIRMKATAATGLQIEGTP